MMLLQAMAMATQVETALENDREFAGWSNLKFSCGRNVPRGAWVFTLAAVRDRDKLPVVVQFVVTDREIAATKQRRMINDIQHHLRAQLDSFLSCPCGTFESDGHVIYVPCSLHSSSPPPC